ncbi:MAG: pyridoxal phosphate-dependent aminotransferase [Erysipelotrichales bacterium]
MSRELSKKILSINPSATLAMSSKADVLRKDGVDIIAFNVGEPDFNTPKHIRDAMINAIKDGKSKYVAVSGIVELKDAIINKFKRDNNLDYQTSQIIVSTGAKQALYEVIHTLVNDNDDIIIPTPCWVSYEEMVKSANGNCLFVPTLSDFQLDIDAIEKVVTSKTKAIIISTPNNPSGAVYSKESLDKLANLAIKHDFYIIADEIYEKLIYSNKPHYSIGTHSKEAYERTITINGFSKTYAMTGYRIGYAAGPIEVIKAMTNLQAHLTSNSTSVVQYGAIAALNEEQELVEEMVEEFKERRNLAFKLLSEINDLKYEEVEGAFYIMLDVSSYFNKTYNSTIINNVDDMSMYLLEEAHVALVSGKAFKSENHLRFSYSNSKENIEKGIKQIKRALDNLK